MSLTLLILFFLWFIVISIITGVYLYVRDVGAVGTTIYCILFVVQTICWILTFTQESAPRGSDDAAGAGMANGLAFAFIVFVETMYSLLYLAIIIYYENKHLRRKAPSNTPAGEGGNDSGGDDDHIDPSA